jgi:hypothetical protein
MLGYRLLSEAKRELEAAVSFYDSEHRGLVGISPPKFTGYVGVSPNLLWPDSKLDRTSVVGFFVVSRIRFSIPSKVMKSW